MASKKKSPTRHSWESMMSRCTNPRRKDYPRYGGRGITVSERFQNYKLFLEDMGERPEGHTLDRIDPDGPYALWNCRWASEAEQAVNKRNTVMVTYEGRRVALADLAREHGVDREILSSRLNRGWDIERALSEPVRKKSKSKQTAPKTRCSGQWTEARYWGFLRSGLRQMSRRWPPIVRDALRSVRRAYSGPNKRQKWEYQCEECGSWFMGKEVQVHHKDPCGSLKSGEDLCGFVEKLFCEVDNLEVLCVACHRRRDKQDA